MPDPGDTTASEKVKNAKKETQWTSSDEALLVAKLVKARDDGLQADSGWKPVTWTIVVEALAGSEDVSGGIAKGVEACKSRWQRKAKPWRKKTFPLYDDLASLVDGIVATGEGAFRPGREKSHTPGNVETPTPTEPSPSSPRTTNDEDIHPSLRDTTMSDDEQLELDADPDADADSEPEMSAGKKVHRDASAGNATTKTKSQKRRSRTSGSAAMLALSGSLDAVTEAFKESADTPAAGILTTPQRRTAAIQAIEESEDLSDEEMLDAVELFREKPDVADAYMAIKKKPLRTAYLKRTLSRYTPY
ncbi:hypothetical protein SCHPADRAFT_838762 [Schizopora paradoxa]|uniref:Myb-like domain-containing protein n=1 Tax=Schizopora paradoxa TaxID=27342 RepID=A0A0H2R2C9_9AGAM|nr:hypothetical protein SCHPADRAFT_838762 [Schizopora paradoxa]